MHALVLLVFLFSCTTKEKFEEIDVTTAQQLLSEDENTLVLDVRTPAEYAEGHIEGAINIDISDDSFSDKVAELEKDKTYIVHCAANVENGRSAKSLKIMSDLGFEHLISMEGGFTAWQQEGQSSVRE
ncbi:MAG: rhodanese-like domain-containing protein [Bacteroidota bacterium]